jgi:hypothetical protein
MINGKKTNNKFFNLISILIVVVIIFSFLLGNLYGIKVLPVSVLGSSSAVSARLNSNFVGIASAGANVYGSDNEKLFYYPDNGLVFTENGFVTYDSIGAPIFFNIADRTFSHQGLQFLSYLIKDPYNFYLVDGVDQIQSTKLDDTIYLVGLKAGYDIYCTYKSVTHNSFWDIFLGIYGWTEYFYYDLFGRELDPKGFNEDLSFAGAIGKALLGTAFGGCNVLPVFAGLIKNETTIRNLIKEILLSLPDDNIISNTPKDDHGNPILCSEYGQLYDIFLYPLIGNDAMPLFYRDGVYTGYDGRELSVYEGVLYDVGGVKVRSVIDALDFKATGRWVYFLYMLDDVTVVPAYGGSNYDEFIKGVYYDFNDNLLNMSLFREVKASEVDARATYPEWFEPENFFDRLLAALKSFWGQIKDIVAIIVICIIAFILIPLILPLIVSFFKAIFGAISGGIRAITGLFKK